MGVAELPARWIKAIERNRRGRRPCGLNGAPGTDSRHAGKEAATRNGRDLSILVVSLLSSNGFGL